MDKDLISARQMFLVPASIQFAALGVASTEQLKTLVSVMGLATSSVWAVKSKTSMTGVRENWAVSGGPFELAVDRNPPGYH